MAVTANSDFRRPGFRPAHTRSLPVFLFLWAGTFVWPAYRFQAATLPPAAQRQVDFVQDIQPILSARCYECHGPDRQENGLRWDNKASALKGGSSGPAIVPGKSTESRMIRLVAGMEKNLVMPKRGERLTAEQIGVLRAWIDQGATWPDAVAEGKSADKSDWWSFKPAKKPPLPSLASLKNKKWVRN